jgi:hypothetical protein
MNSELERETSRIADDIVALVEHANGPVTLAELTVR